MSHERPADIARKPWLRRASDAWTDAPLRAAVLTYIEAFVRSHNWTSRYEVTERFSDRGVNVRVPRTSPVQPPDREPFYQRPGLRLLVLAVYRDRDGERLEVAVSWPRGNETPEIERAQLLSQATLALEAEHRRRPPP